MPPMTREELDRLVKDSIEAFNRMSAEEKKEHLRRQRISWVYGNLVLSNPSITREMVEEAAAKGFI